MRHCGGIALQRGSKCDEAAPPSLRRRPRLHHLSRLLSCFCCLLLLSCASAAQVQQSYASGDSVDSSGEGGIPAAAFEARDPAHYWNPAWARSHVNLTLQLRCNGVEAELIRHAIPLLLADLRYALIVSYGIKNNVRLSEVVVTWLRQLPSGEPMILRIDETANTPFVPNSGRRLLQGSSPHVQQQLELQRAQQTRHLNTEQPPDNNTGVLIQLSVIDPAASIALRPDLPKPRLLADVQGLVRDLAAAPTDQIFKTYLSVWSSFLGIDASALILHRVNLYVDRSTVSSGVVIDDGEQDPSLFDPGRGAGGAAQLTEGGVIGLALGFLAVAGIAVVVVRSSIAAVRAGGDGSGVTSKSSRSSSGRGSSSGSGKGKGKGKRRRSSGSARAPALQPMPTIEESDDEEEEDEEKEGGAAARSKAALGKMPSLSGGGSVSTAAEAAGTAHTTTDGAADDEEEGGDLATTAVHIEMAPYPHSSGNSSGSVVNVGAAGVGFVKAPLPEAAVVVDSGSGAPVAAAPAAAAAAGSSRSGHRLRLTADAGLQVGEPQMPSYSPNYNPQKHHQLQEQQEQHGRSSSHSSAHHGHHGTVLVLQEGHEGHCVSGSALSAISGSGSGDGSGSSGSTRSREEPPLPPAHFWPAAAEGEGTVALDDGAAASGNADALHQHAMTYDVGMRTEAAAASSASVLQQVLMRARGYALSHHTHHLPHTHTRIEAGGYAPLPGMHLQRGRAATL